MLLAPTSESEVEKAVQAAIAAGKPLMIEGNGTKRGLGRPSQAEQTLSLKNLSGVTLYEPSEMVIGAWAGTPLSVVEKTLAAKGQMLPFEPMDHRVLFATTGEPTIGAVAACNNAGPRRIMSGGARDSLIGVRFVNGRGEIIKNGGRVMKNVTGLDLVKLQAGAFGTLGVLTEVIFKVLPRPAVAATVSLQGLSDAAGIAVLCKAMGSPFEPTGVAHLPAGIDGASARTLIRIEGFPEQISYRSGELAKLLGKIELITGHDHDKLWADIRDVRFFAPPDDNAVWRISVAPSRAAALVAELRTKLDLRCFFDWSGGLIWIAVSPDGNVGASFIRPAVSQARGHAMLARAPDAVRAAVDVFQPLDPAVMKIQTGLKTSFDPDGLLNPGRMYPGL